MNSRIDTLTFFVILDVLYSSIDISLWGLFLGSVFAVAMMLFFRWYDRKLDK